MVETITIGIPFDNPRFKPWAKGTKFSTYDSIPQDFKPWAVTILFSIFTT
jgi:hypothetical protein